MKSVGGPEGATPETSLMECDLCCPPMQLHLLFYGALVFQLCFAWTQNHLPGFKNPSTCFTNVSIVAFLVAKHLAGLS